MLAGYLVFYLGSMTHTTSLRSIKFLAPGGSGSRLAERRVDKKAVWSQGQIQKHTTALKPLGPKTKHKPMHLLPIKQRVLRNLNILGSCSVQCIRRGSRISTKSMHFYGCGPTLFAMSFKVALVALSPLHMSSVVIETGHESDSGQSAYHTAGDDAGVGAVALALCGGRGHGALRG